MQFYNDMEATEILLFYLAVVQHKNKKNLAQVLLLVISPTLHLVCGTTVLCYIT